MRKKLQILCVVGARPNFIKLAPLIHEATNHKRLQLSVVHTGQHYDADMSDVFFKELRIARPRYHLNVGSGSHAYQTGEILKGVESILLGQRFDCIVLIGDVNSTLAGALAAAKLCVPIAHIEAGVRSFDRTMPEEINRLVTDRLASFLFCPTETGVANLQAEGIHDDVSCVGDIMYETFLRNAERAQKTSRIIPALGLTPKRYYLLTLHRGSNVDNVPALTRLLAFVSRSHLPIIFPVHPRTQKTYSLIEPRRIRSTIRAISPVSYNDMLMLEKNAKKIITDSGGVQKEAFWWRVPCITVRNNTEWPETVESGWNTLVAHTDHAGFKEALKKPEPQYPTRESGLEHRNVAKRILDMLEQNLSHGS